MRNCNNSELIERCIKRDPAAWAEFVRRFSPIISFSVSRALRKFTGSSDPGDLADIRQDVFVALWNKDKLRDVKNRDRIDHWLSVVSMNAAANHLRLKKREALIGDLFYFDNMADSRCRHPLEGMLVSDDIREIASALNAREKLVFRLYFEKGKKDVEISQILNMSRNSVTKTISVIRKKMKNLKNLS